MARYALPEGVLTPGIERKSQCNAEADDLRGHGPHTTLANTRGRSGTQEGHTALLQWERPCGPRHMQHLRCMAQDSCPMTATAFPALAPGAPMRLGHTLEMASPGKPPACRPAWGGPRGGPPSHPPGWGPPGRGGYPGGPRPPGGRTPGRGRAMPGRNSAQQGRGGGQATPQKQSQQSGGQGKTKKQKLVDLDDKPAKPWKPLNAAEIAEGQRWQEERRKRYPSDANVAKRASEASARRQRGELDPEGEERRARLHEVIARQQQLGLLKEAGTADLLRAASGRGAGFGGGFRGGRGGRSGRQGGRGPGRGQGFAGASVHAVSQKRPGDFPGRDSDACKQPKQDISAQPPPTVAEGSALNGLVSYNSDSDTEEAGHGTSAPQVPLAPMPAAQQQQSRPLHPAHHTARGGRHSAAHGRGRGRQVAQPLPPREATLLEKLLAKDIRAEHNWLLQCMRFLVANNYLQDVGSKPLHFPPEPSAAGGKTLGITLQDLPQDSSDSDDAVEAAAKVPIPEGPTSGGVEEGFIPFGDGSDAQASEAFKSELEEAESSESSGSEDPETHQTSAGLAPSSAAVIACTPIQIQAEL